MASSSPRTPPGRIRHGATTASTAAFYWFALLLLLLCGTPAQSRNTCEEISRCSECVYDQTQGFMPPSLSCGWCETTQSCKQVNSTILSYYGAATNGDNADSDGEATTLLPSEKAAFRAAFCEDLRERSVNGVCPDMSCRAARTTNNIYICRAPPLIALVFGCLLFVLTVVVYMWMRTIRQLPWKYEPFLSDMLAGRKRTDDDHYVERVSMADVTNTTTAATAATAALPAKAAPTSSSPSSAHRHLHGSPRRATRPGSPAHDGPLPLPPPSTTTAAAAATPRGACEGDANDDETASAETGSTISNPSYLDNASHNVVVAHHPRTPPPPPPTSFNASLTVGPSAPAGERDALAVSAATGYCPICKCRQPACLGPGEVCFWCNVARFTFVPFYIALISSVVVIVLDFAVSLKPWFSDWFFAEVLLLAYASYAGLAFYIVRHHGRAPLFFFESEAERRASQQVWSSTHNRPGSTNFSASVPGSRNASTLSPPLSPGLSRTHHHHRRQDRLKIHLLNDARRNMAATYYFRLALQLRGRPLLTCFPELRKYETQLEAMQASPATLTAVGDAVAVLRSATAAGSASRGNSAPASPKTVSLLRRSGGGSSGNAYTHASTSPGVPVMNVPVISPFATAVPPPAESALAAVEATTAAAAAAAPATPLSAAAASPRSASSPSASSAFEGTSVGNVRLPPLAAVAATPPPESNGTAKPGEMATAAGTAAAAAVGGGASSPPPACSPAAPPVPPAGGPIGSAAATNVPEALARQKRGETVQLLSSDFLSVQYCRALKTTLFRDEYITWCSKPNLRGVLMENEWLLLDLAVGFLFGVWMVLLSSVTDTSYTIVELSGSTAVAACGLIVMALFAVLLIIVVRQCGRLYVLTNERLITVYESVVTPVTTATELSTVRFAALYGYRGLWSKHPCLTFSWEVPATERKMPVIKSHMFPGIMNLHEFLFFFRLVAPQMPFHLDQISQSTKQDRQEWRLHMFIAVGAVVAMPIVTIYPEAMPEFLSFSLYLLGVLLAFSTLLRGFRAQQMTYAPLNVAASWAPEGELSDFNPVNAAPALPLSPPPPPHPPTLMLPTAAAAIAAGADAPRGDEVRAPAAAVANAGPSPARLATTATPTHAASVQAAVPLGGTSPTTRHPPPTLFEVGSRAVQIATPVSRSPVLRSAGEFVPSAPTPSTAALVPRQGEERSATAKPAAAAARESRGGVSHAARTAAGATTAATLAAAPATLLIPASSISGHTVVPHPITVPVTSAVREMEESLLGGGLSTNNSFAGTSATVYSGAAAGGGSRPGTARNSPHRRRVSSIDVAGVNTGTLSIGPAATAVAAATGGRGPVAGAHRNAGVLTTGGSPPSPTAAASSGAFVGSLSLSSNQPADADALHGHDAVVRPAAPRSWSASEEAASTPSAATPNAAAFPQSSSSSVSGGVGLHVGKSGRHSPPLAHVVPASVRSTKLDGHTTWGDQVAGQE